MNIMYKCCFCQNIYEWYDGLYENPKYNFHDECTAKHQKKEYPEESGFYISANAILLAKVITDDVGLNVETLNTNINMCPDCMRKLLNSYHDGSNNSIWGSI